MNEDFARTLALLRQERGISQRQVAAALGVSQALLSHYENGLREPGLAFVVKACDYYNVSADYLLGRTLSRDGTTILDAESLYDVSDERDHIMQGSVLATLSRKLIVNSVNILFDLLGKLGNKAAIKAAGIYLSTGIYILFRHLHRANPKLNDEFFSNPESRFVAGIARADIIFSESEYLEALDSEKKKGSDFPPMSHDEMVAAYPGTYQSLLQIIHVCSERLNSEAACHRKNAR